MLPLVKLVTNTLPPIHPEATTVALLAKVEISSLWKSFPTALTIYPVLGVINLNLF
jgi:hypothetical protein